MSRVQLVCWHGDEFEQRGADLAQTKITVETNPQKLCECMHVGTAKQRLISTRITAFPSAFTILTTKMIDVSWNQTADQNAVWYALAFMIFRHCFAYHGIAAQSFDPHYKSKRIQYSD